MVSVEYVTDVLGNEWELCKGHTDTGIFVQHLTRPKLNTVAQNFLLKNSLVGIVV